MGASLPANGVVVGWEYEEQDGRGPLAGWTLSALYQEWRRHFYGSAGCWRKGVSRLAHLN